MTEKFDNNSPIYIQIANNIKQKIILGELSPGKKLLSVRELALKINVNPNTIQKAYGVLEEEMLIWTASTNGKFVTKDNYLIDNYKQKFINNKVNNFINDMTNINISLDEIINHLKKRKEDN